MSVCVCVCVCVCVRTRTLTCVHVLIKRTDPEGLGIGLKPGVVSPALERGV